MGHGLGLDYATYTKRGFLLGLGIFLLGAAGALLGRALLGELPGWEQTVFFDAMVVGIAVGFASVFVVGILLPLTD